MVNDIRQSVQAIFNREGHIMMLRTQELSDLLGGLRVWCTRESNGERVELRKVCDGGQLVLIIDTNQSLSVILIQYLGRVSILLQLFQCRSFQAQRFPLRNRSNQ